MNFGELGDKPLSLPIMVRLPTHMCVSLPEWVKSKLYILYKNIIQLKRCNSRIKDLKKMQVWQNILDSNKLF